MELAMVPASTRKRPMSQLIGEAGDRIFKFRILLPNGCTTAITMQEPAEEMDMRDFISFIRQEYEHGVRRISDGKRPIKWDGQIYLEDMSETLIRKRICFRQFQPNKLNLLRLHDESKVTAHTFKNMWDLTPDTDLLAELPAQYTFEASLADLIDNSLQALWSNCFGRRRLVSIKVDETSISIMDTGPGMDGSDENSIVKWGKMGSSSHRASKKLAVGGKPPYLTPYFGMFGYGGPVASMHLGRHAIVSSKTVTSKKVYTLHFERDALLKGGSSWRTDGGIRNPSLEEMEISPHASFTKVEIYDLKQRCSNVSQLQCRLKDIYFPYIQCDEMNKAGKTATPVEFQVNGFDLAEVDGGEIATTNVHSCNGSDFVFQVCFSSEQEASPCEGMLRSANARLKCVYFPIVKGKESIDRILEKLRTDGWDMTEKFKSFARVTIRRLGRLLPDARWGMLPFMEPKLRKGNKVQVLKRCCVRVKCFIDTDAGFSPTPSKTDLAFHDSFTIALKHLGNKFTESDVSIDLFKNGKKMSLLQLEKEYMEWLLNMHEKYDEEMDSGEDQPVLVVNPPNAKKLGISSDVVRVHKVISRKGQYWKSGEKIKILKGADGLPKNNLYATLEYIVLEGFEGDAGRESRLICRPLGSLKDKGCVLEEGGDQASLNIRESLSFPVSVIDLGKCEKVDDRIWNSQLDKYTQRSPSAINILSSECCCQLEIGEALPVDATINAGYDPPDRVVAVIRPANFTCQSLALDQKYIVKDDHEMMMKISYMVHKNHKNCDCIYTVRVKPSSCNGLQGLYLFAVRDKHPRLFDKAGVYIFSFSLISTNCQTCEIQVVVVPSYAKVWELKLSALADERLFPLCNGVHAPPFSIMCYDAYQNQLPFEDVPDVDVTLKAGDKTISCINNLKLSLSSCKRSLEIKDLLIECQHLDQIRPHYMATIEICSRDKAFCTSAPCKVSPGSIHSIELQESSQLIKEFVPDDVIKNFCLEVFDVYGSHVSRGTEVFVEVDGLQIQDFSGSHRKVDDEGYVNLNGLLKVVGGYGTKAYLFAYDGSRRLFEKELQVARRELQLMSKVPNFFVAGSRMENLVFHVVSSDGAIDEEINGQQHTLAVSSDLASFICRTQYSFSDGICIITSVQIPEVEGRISFRFYHSLHPELHANVEIVVMQAPKLEMAEADLSMMQSPCLSCGRLSSPMSSCVSAAQLQSLMELIMHEHTEISNAVGEINQQVELYKDKLHSLESLKETIVEEIFHFQEFADPKVMRNFDHFMNAKELIVQRIKKQKNSAAALFCDVPTAIQDKEPHKHLRDVIGLVALLGSVPDNNLSRLLAQYIGQSCMLGIVCKSYESAVALEKYEGIGDSNQKSGLHKFASSQRREARGQFLVISLEDIRPYSGKLDSLGNLALPDPALPSGKKPCGFLGYAVNMIHIDILNGRVMTNEGYSLRETLFYRLFGDVQVYRTREDMRQARSCLKSGAVSLDGGIIRGNGVVGEGELEPEIVFPVVRPNVRRSLFRKSIGEAVDFDSMGNKLSQLNAVQSEIDEVKDALSTAEKKCVKRTAKLQKFVNDRNHILNGSIPLNSKPSGYNEKQL